MLNIGNQQSEQVLSFLGMCFSVSLSSHFYTYIITDLSKNITNRDIIASRIPVIMQRLYEQSAVQIKSIFWGLLLSTQAWFREMQLGTYPFMTTPHAIQIPIRRRKFSKTVQLKILMFLEFFERILRNPKQLQNAHRRLRARKPRDRYENAGHSC